MRLAVTVLIIGLTLPGLGCGADSAAGPSEVSEAAALEPEPEEENVFTFEVTGSVEAEIDGPGDLRCIDMGDSGPGYFLLDNGEKTGTIAFQFPLDATVGTHSLTTTAEVQAAQQVGKAYSTDVSLPLQGFHMSTSAEGSLTFDELGTRPGERLRGSFEVKTDSMGESIEVEGVFDFLVPDGARNLC